MRNYFCIIRRSAFTASVFNTIFYDNKKFLVNCANYLLGDENLISVRSKNIKMRMLDPEIVKEEKGFFKILNTAFPIGLILLISLVFILFRRMKYSK